MKTCDFLIIGGGIIGLSLSRELKKNFPDCKVILIEKEKECGLHASSRNSGVLHAGFYYSADSFKARFTRRGNQLLTQYCKIRNIKINKCGKLIVAKNEKDLHGLQELLNRGKKCEVPLTLLSERDAKEIEPRVKTYKKALFSPVTSTVNPKEIILSLTEDAISDGVEIYCESKYIKRNKKEVISSSDTYKPGFVVNAAGLYADIIARDFGFSKDYRILPFKGLYLYSDESQGSIHTNIYPVPDLKNPFLGVHFTLTVDGRFKIGPTAIPACWREHYSGWEGFNLREFTDILFRQAGLFMSSGFDFKQVAFNEIKKNFRSKLVFHASQLLEGVKVENYKEWAPTGIRAQLLDIKQKKLEMDFVLEGDNFSMHILNAVSPAFTCAIPFAQYVCEKIKTYF